MRKVSGNIAASVAAVVTTTDPNIIVIDINNHHLENENNNNNATTTTNTTAVVGEGPNDSASIQHIMEQNRELHQQNVDLVSTIKKQHDFIKIELQQMKHMMQRFVNQPPPAQAAFGGSNALQIQEQPVLANDDNDDSDDDDDDNESHHSNNDVIDNDTIPYESTLSQQPKDLYQLWREYQYGLDGRKAVKRFTARERRNVKYKYHRRKIVWDQIIKMKKSGKYKTSHIAIEELYRRYGGKDKSITEIIKQIRRDRKKKPAPPAAAAALQKQSTVVGDCGPLVQQQLPLRANDDNDIDDTTIIDDGTIPFELTLSDQPKDLYQLWEEYEYGLGGRKAAKRFNRKERGKVKCKYTRRKVVWDKIKQLIKHNGHTSQTAIEEIYRIYGTTNGDDGNKKLTVTEITINMRKDRPKICQKRKTAQTQEFK